MKFESEYSFHKYVVQSQWHKICFGFFPLNKVALSYWTVWAALHVCPSCVVPRGPCKVHHFCTFLCTFYSFYFFFNQYPVIPLNTGRGSAFNTNNNNRLPPSHFSWLQNCMFSHFYVVSFRVSNSHFQSKWKAVEIYLMTWQCRGAVQGTTFQNIHLTSEQCRRPRGTFRHLIKEHRPEQTVEKGSEAWRNGRWQIWKWSLNTTVMYSWE